jgi:hypothetical protein
MSGEAVVGLNGPVLLFAAGITLLTTVVCGLVPALRATRRDLQPQLVGNGKGPGGGLQHGKVRAALVIGQVALSFVLLIEAGLMMRSLYKLTHIDLGFNPKNILVAAFAPSRKGVQIPDRALLTSAEGHARFQRAAEKIGQLPGVASVAVSNTIPGYGPSGGPRVGVPGETRDVEAGMDECDENCLDTLEMRLLAGRWLSRAEVQTRQLAAVVNERLAQALFAETNPVGKQLEVKDFKSRFSHSSANLPENAVFEIVGVVGDSKNNGPQAPVLPEDGQSEPEAFYSCGGRKPYGNLRRALAQCGKAFSFGFIAQSFEKAGTQAEQWLFTPCDLNVLAILFPRCNH